MVGKADYASVERRLLAHMVAEGSELRGLCWVVLGYDPTARDPSVTVEEVCDLLTRRVMAEPRQCSTCRHWHGPAMRCRRYPPIGERWSKPEPSDLCGEFERLGLPFRVSYYRGVGTFS